MGGLANPIGALADIGLSLFNGLSASNQFDWNQGAKVNVLNALNGLLQNATGQVGQLSNGIIPSLLNFSNQNLSTGPAYQTNAQNDLGALMNGVNNGQFTTAADPNSLLPGYNNLMATNASSWNTQNQASNQLANMLSAIQSNPQLAQVFSQAAGIANGGGGQKELANAAGNIFNANGTTQFGNTLQNALTPFLNSGGYTGQLNNVSNIGNSLTNPNPGVEQAQAVAGQILGQSPLLSMNQVASMAANQAATQSNAQYQQAKQQLLNTTGIGGPAIASGGANELLNQIGDQAMQAQSAAETQAMMNQQALQEQQFGQGANLFNLATQGSLGYTGQGLNAILQAANQATGNLGTAGNLGLGVNAQNLQNLLGGGTLQGEANNTTLQALQSMLGGLGTQNAMTGTDASALANLLNTGTGQLGLASSNMFGAQNLNQTEQQNTVNALLNSIGQYGGMGSTMTQQGLQGMQDPMQYLGEWMSTLGNVYGNMTSLFGNQSLTPIGFPTGASIGGGR